MSQATITLLQWVGSEGVVLSDKAIESERVATEIRLLARVRSGGHPCTTPLESKGPGQRRNLRLKYLGVIKAS